MYIKQLELESQTLGLNVDLPFFTSLCLLLVHVCGHLIFSKDFTILH